MAKGGVVSISTGVLHINGEAFEIESIEFGLNEMGINVGAKIKVGAKIEAEQAATPEDVARLGAELEELRAK
jgi:hypothetical protein